MTKERCKELLNEHGLSVALFEPEIPQNTGNIGRLCLGTGANLMLVGKLGFLLREKELRRAGLDYWPRLDVQTLESFDIFKERVEKRRVVIVSKYAEKFHYEFDFRKNDVLLFGKESKGLPKYVWDEYRENAVSIPMKDDVRSFNLANSVSAVLHEALRQFLSLSEA